MRDVWFAIPGDPSTLTGGYIYARRLTAALSEAGWRVRPLRLPEGFPFPSPADLAASRYLFAEIPDGACVFCDGLAFGALPQALIAEHAFRWVALVHHPLALETGLTASMIHSLRESERTALAQAKAVIATSKSTADTLARDYGVPLSRLSVALPGTDMARRAPGTGHPPRLLCVATLTPRKGHDLLINALSKIAQLDWTCALVGSTTRDPNTAASVISTIEKAGIRERMQVLGELKSDALEAAYDAADIFVLPSRHEGYGMAFAEAMARGLPIVACAAGAVTDTVPSDAGILVPVDDVPAIAAALRRLISDPAERARRAEAAWRHGQRLPTWTETAANVASVLQGVAP